MSHQPVLSFYFLDMKYSLGTSCHVISSPWIYNPGTILNGTVVGKNKTRLLHGRTATSLQLKKRDSNIDRFTCLDKGTRRIWWLYLELKRLEKFVQLLSLIPCERKPLLKHFAPPVLQWMLGVPHYLEHSSSNSKASRRVSRNFLVYASVSCNDHTTVSSFHSSIHSLG